MTLLRRVRRSRSGAALLVTASAIAMTPPAANAETVANVDVSLGALAASNPYLRDGTDTESGAVSLTLSPYISATDEDTTATLDGNLNLENFFDDYATDVSAQVGGSIEHRFSERTTVSANVGFQSSDSAARSFYDGP